MTHFQDVVCCQFQTGSAWQLVLLFPDEPETLPTLFFFFKAPRAVPAAAFPPPQPPPASFALLTAASGDPSGAPPSAVTPPRRLRRDAAWGSRAAGPGGRNALRGGSWLAYPRHSPRLRRAPEAALPAPLTRGARPRGSSPTRAGLLAFPPLAPRPGPRPPRSPPKLCRSSPGAAALYLPRACGSLPLPRGVQRELGKTPRFPMLTAFCKRSVAVVMRS